MFPNSFALRLLTFALYSSLFFVVYSTATLNEDSEFYSNKDANTCFYEKATPECSSSIKECTENYDCSLELSNYQGCSFGSTESEIFNGYCFRKWRENAKLTSDLINCMNKSCNLEYNSMIGLQELFECAQETIINNYEQCTQQCAKDLNKIRQNFGKMKVNQLFESVKMQNEAAEMIVELIRERCVKPGSMKTSTVTTTASSPSSLTEEIQSGKEAEETRNSNPQMQEL